MVEIENIAAHGLTAEEMQKLHNQLINECSSDETVTMARAQQIAEYALYDGDASLINSELEELMAIRPEQIRKAASDFLDTENRSLLDVVPAGQG